MFGLTATLASGRGKLIAASSGDTSLSVGVVDCGGDMAVIVVDNPRIAAADKPAVRMRAERAGNLSRFGRCANAARRCSVVVIFVSFLVMFAIVILSVLFSVVVASVTAFGARLFGSWASGSWEVVG